MESQRSDHVEQPKSHPPAALTNRLDVDFHPAPGSEDHIGVALKNRVPCDNSVLRFPALKEFRKDQFAASNCDQFLHPLNATDDRIIPFFEEHPRAISKFPGCCLDSSSPLVYEPISSVPSACFPKIRAIIAMVSKISAILR